MAATQSKRLSRSGHRIVGVILFLGSIAVLVVAFLLLESSEWTEGDLFRTLPIAGIVSLFFVFGLLIQVAVLRARQPPEREIPSDWILLAIFGGQVGLLWAVFYLSRGLHEGELTGLGGSDSTQVEAPGATVETSTRR